MILYPQLPHPAAEQLSESIRRMGFADVTKMVALDHPEVFFTPTGGSRVARSPLERLRSSLLTIATEFGYPESGGEQAFDVPAASALHSMMQISASEAAKPGVWEFLSCVLFCDIVRWRFPGDGVSPLERFLAGRRNTLQRLWWRGFVFHDPSAREPYGLIAKLGEDEAVQIMERPFLAGSRNLSRTVARELIAASERYPRISRRFLIREAQKRMRRLGAFTSFEAIEEASLPPFVRDIFERVAASVG